MPNHTITAEEARQLLDYNPETGAFTWRVGRTGTARAGTQAGWATNRGYIAVKVKNRQYSAHRLAWLMAYGVWPQEFIDHIDGNPTNNRLDNLREASHTENSRNRRIQSRNTSGFKGVYWNKAARKWHAQIHTDGRNKHLGLFVTAEEAYAAYCTAAKELHGEFARLI
jgi:hypothetical protein